MSRATIEEVATAAGVSRSTVSRVVNGSTAVSPEALVAVRAAISELNYVPNRAARSLASKQTNVIALVVPEDTERFFGDAFLAAVVSGISARLRKSDYLLNVLIASNDPGDKATRFITDGGVDGAIIVSHHADNEYVNRIAAAVPVVFGGRPQTVRDTDYIVDIDNFGAGRVATEHLLRRGRTRIAAVTGSMSMPAAIDRLRGFRAAMADAGLAPNAEIDGDFSEAGGAVAARILLAADEGPDAIFAASDAMANGILGVLRSAGVRVPDDIAVVGFDDSRIAVAADPPLTTMRQPLYAQGEAMATLMLQALAGEDPKRIKIMPTELVLRASA